MMNERDQAPEDQPADAQAPEEQPAADDVIEADAGVTETAQADEPSGGLMQKLGRWLRMGRD